MSEGIKHDSEKPRMDLLSSSWVEGVSDVLTFGARKYDAHNWRKGLARSRLLGACLRHVFAYLRGEDCDPETGLLHLYHASCCLMFASELHFTRPDLDDRYKAPSSSDKEGVLKIDPSILELLKGAAKIDPSILESFKRTVKVDTLEKFLQKKEFSNEKEK